MDNCCQSHHTVHRQAHCHTGNEHSAQPASVKMTRLIALLPALILNACVTSPHRMVQRTHSASAAVSPASALRDYETLKRLYHNSQWEPFREKVQAFVKTYPYDDWVPSVENLWGLSLLQQKNFVAAIAHFKKALAFNPEHADFNQYTRFNLATAYFESNQLQESQEHADAIQFNRLNIATQIKTGYLKAALYQKKGLYSATVRQLLTIAQLDSPHEFLEQKSHLTHLLDTSLQLITTPSLLVSCIEDFQNSPLLDIVLLHLARLEMTAGDFQKSELYLNQLLSKFPQSSHCQLAQEMLGQCKKNTEIAQKSIGLLLPMKGKLAKFGNRSLQGISAAFDIFQPDESTSRITLVIEDSGETPEEAIEALHRLVYKHRVLAVIGPMLSRGIDLIAQSAEKLEIPLISLSRLTSTPCHYVFQAGLTQQVQAAEIARYAMESLHFKKFAILFPKNKFGAELTKSFWETIESLGGSIVGAQSYTPGDTDFRQGVDQLSGLYYTAARQTELNELAQQRQFNRITKRTIKTQQYFNLKPKVDYDAVFLADEAKVASQIIPTFAYRDIEHIPFLGTSSWNTPDFLARIKHHDGPIYLVDAFHPQALSSAGKRFVERYFNIFQQEPSVLEAIAYDAALSLKKILADGNLSRREFKEKLTSMHDIPGVTGKLSYKNGQWTRHLQLLTVQNGQIASVLGKTE